MIFRLSINKTLLVLLLLFNINNKTHSQINHTMPTKGVELKIHYSFLAPHYDYVSILCEQHFHIYQLNIFKAGNHLKEWDSLYNYPQYGVSLIYSPLSSPNYLGFGVAAAPFINFPLHRSNNLSLSLFIGSGIGFIEKPYDPRSNFMNQAIGSKINVPLLGQFDLRYRVNRFSEISAGISITHFSNGKIKTPNLGINNIGIFTGYARHLAVENNLKPSANKRNIKNFLEYNLFIAGAIKQNYPIGGKYYLYTVCSFNAKKIIKNKSKLGAGTDIFYDYSERAYFQNKGIEKPDIIYIKPAVYALYDIILGRSSVFFHIGTYLYAFAKNQGIGMIYDRVGVQYYFNDLLSAQLSLKTHLSRADAIELALNFSF